MPKPARLVSSPYTVYHQVDLRNFSKYNNASFSFALVSGGRKKYKTTQKSRARATAVRQPHQVDTRYFPKYNSEFNSTKTTKTGSFMFVRTFTCRGQPAPNEICPSSFTFLDDNCLALFAVCLLFFRWRKPIWE